MTEQVKCFSYSVSHLLGAKPSLPVTIEESTKQERGEIEKSENEEGQKSYWSVSLAFPRVRDHAPNSSLRGLFYCVIYLTPGDYHRIHSPVNWNVSVRRHFTGRLFPVSERAVRAIRNLYVENERVVLEGRWKEGYMAMIAIGATNIGSIELLIEPSLRTNRPTKRFLHSEPPEEMVYEPEGTEVALRKGDELGSPYYRFPTPC